MPSVDERVVELEFDNKDFANRVGDTMSSLKQLENALQMGGSAKGISEVNNAIGRMNVNPMLDAAESVSNKFSMMRAIAVSAINRITNGVIDAGEKLVGWMPSQVISGGWNRAANVAKAKFTFEGLAKGTSATWEQMSEDINYAVQGTAYTFDAAALAASSFFASGIKQGDQMKQALRGVSGVAAMTSSDYSDIARIFTTVAGNGRLMGEQLNQISSRGINAAATLASKLNVTEEEVRDLVSKGKIDFATFAEAMDEAFGEHATEANKTFQGSLANIKAALSKLGEKFAAPLMENMIPVFNGIRNLFSNFKDQVDPIVDVWKNVLSTLSPAVTEFFETLASYVKTDEFAAGIQKIADKFSVVQGAVEKLVSKKGNRGSITLEDWEKLADSPYADILKDKLVEVASEADDGFKKMYDSYGSFEKSLESGWLTKTTFLKAADEMKKMSESLDEVGVSAEDASAYLEECWKYAYEVERGDWGNGIERFNRLTEAGLSYHDIQGLVNHDLLGWDYTLEGLNTTLRKSGKYTDEQIAAIEAFAKELEEGGGSLSEFMDIFNSVDKMTNFQLVLESISNVMDFLKGVFLGVSTAFSQVFLEGREFNDFGESLRYWLEQLYFWTSGLKDGLKGAKGSIVTVYKVSKLFFTVLKTVGTATKKIFDAFVDIGGTLLDTFSPLLDLVMIVFSRISELASGANKVSTEFSFLDMVLNAVKTGVEAFAGVMKPLLERFVAWVDETDLVGRAFNRITQAIDWAKPKVSTAISTIKAEFEKFWPSIKDSLGKVPGLIEGIFGKLQEVLGPFSSKLSSGLSGVDASGFSGVGDAFSNLVDSFSEGKGRLEAFLDFVGEIFTGALDAITNFLDGFFTVKTEFSSTASAITTDAEDTASRVESVVDRMMGSGNTIGSIFGEGSPLGAFLSGVSTIIGNLWQTTQNISELLKEVSGLSFEDLFSYFVQGTAVVTMFKYVSAIKSLADSIKGVTDIANGFLDGSHIVSKGITNIIDAVRPSKFFEVALAIMGLALSLWFLSTIPAEDLGRATKALFGLTAVVLVIIGVMAALGKFLGPKSSASLEVLSVAMLAMAGSMLMLSLAAKMMQGVDVESVRSLIDIMLVLGVSAALIGKFVGGVATGAITVLAMAFAIKMLVSALLVMHALDVASMTTEFQMLIAMMGVMAIALAAIGHSNPMGAAVAVIALAAAVLLMVAAIQAVGTLLHTMDNFALACAVVGGILIVFVAAMLGVAAVLSVFPAAAVALGAFGLACLAVAASVLLIAAALWVLSNMNFDNMIKGLYKLYITLSSMDLGKFLGELVLVAVGLVAVGIGLVVIGAGILLIGVGFLALAAGLALLVAIGPIAAGVLVTLGMAMPTFGEGCMSAAKGLLVLGIGLIVAGAGAIVAAAGLSSLAAAMLLFAVAMMAVMHGLPSLGQQIGSGFLNGIGSGAKSALPNVMSFFQGAGDGIFKSLSGKLGGGKSVDLGKGLFSGFQKNAESEMPGALGVVDKFKSMFSGKMDGMDFKSMMSDKGLELPEGFTEGLESGSPDMMASVDDLFGGDLQNYMDTSEFSSMMEEMGYDGDMSFISGLDSGSTDISDYLGGDFYNQFTGEMDGLDLPSAFSDLGKNSVSGLQSGFNGMVGALGESFMSLTDVMKAKLDVDTTPEGQSTASKYAGGVSSMIGAVNDAVSQISDEQRAEFEKASTEASTQGVSSVKNYAASIAEKASLAKASTAAVAKASVNALSASLGAFKAQGSSSGRGYSNGVGGSKGAAYSAGSSIARSAHSGASGMNFYSLGVNAVQGFINGMQSMDWSASRVAAMIGGNAMAALKASLTEDSPSKEAFKYGAWVVAGLANGMSENKKRSDAAAEDLGVGVLSTMDLVRQAIENATNEEMEFNPTITPIVDLDNIKAASSMVDSMLSDTYGLGIGSTLPNYNLYGNNNSGGNSKSVVYNLSVALQYEAGADANMMASDLASALKAKMDLEG